MTLCARIGRLAWREFLNRHGDDNEEDEKENE